MSLSITFLRKTHINQTPNIQLNLIANRLPQDTSTIITNLNASLERLYHPEISHKKFNSNIKKNQDFLTKSIGNFSMNFLPPRNLKIKKFLEERYGLLSTCHSIPVQAAVLVHPAPIINTVSVSTECPKIKIINSFNQGEHNPPAVK